MRRLFGGCQKVHGGQYLIALFCCFLPRAGVSRLLTLGLRLVGRETADGQTNLVLFGGKIIGLVVSVDIRTNKADYGIRIFLIDDRDDVENAIVTSQTQG